MTASRAHVGTERIVTKLVAAVLQNLPAQPGFFLPGLHKGLEVICFFWGQAGLWLQVGEEVYIWVSHSYLIEIIKLLMKSSQLLSSRNKIN